MPQTLKLYEILEKAEIETKIALEIQDWIVETIEEKKKSSMIQFEETKLLPQLQDINSKFGRIEERHEDLNTKMNLRFDLIDEKFTMLDFKFDSFRSEINARFISLEKRFDTTNFLIRLLGVPIVGTTIGALSFLFLQIYEKLQ